MRNPSIKRFALLACVCALPQVCCASIAETGQAAETTPAGPWYLWAAASVVMAMLAGIAVQQYRLRSRQQHKHAAEILAERAKAAQLADGVIHDFRNLLLVVGANVELVSQELDEDHISQANLALVREAVRQGNDLTESLMQKSAPIAAGVERERRVSREVEVKTPEANAAAARGAALVIECDPLLRAMFVSMLRQLGYEASGSGAFEDLAAILDSIEGQTMVLFQQPPDVATLQRSLDSLTAYSQVRQVVMITDETSPRVPTGNVIVVKKPFRLNDLAAALSAVPA